MGGIQGRTGFKRVLIWEKNNWGSITADSYIEHVLDPVLYPFYEYIQGETNQTPFVVEDGAPAHRAQKTKERRAELNIQSLDWPPSSPDLNIIENIWCLLKNRLQAYRPKLTQLEDIKAAVLREWEDIARHEIVRLA
jgi:hypothetical protein